MRVVVLGPGGSGKSTFSQRLAAVTGIPYIELDKRFWGPQLEPTSRHQWMEIQAQLVQGEAWIMDGDLGPYDVTEVRLSAADTVVLLDLPTWVSAWRALRRSRDAQTSGVGSSLGVVDIGRSSCTPSRNTPDRPSSSSSATKETSTG